MRIWITGAGVISAIGNNKAETWEALRNHRSGIAPIRYLQTEHQEFPVGEVKMSNEQMKDLLGIRQEPTTRSALMGIIAMREAWREACLCESDRIGFVNATTVGGMDKSERFYLDFLNNDQHKEYIRTHDCGACTEMIADYFGRLDLVTTVSTACSSAANALVTGAFLIQSGRYDIVIAGGTECLTKYHLNGFNTLMILDRQPCRPFDATRAGLNLGEGAAYVVLESETSARRRGVEAQAVLSGWGNACDAFHQTASSEQGEGATLAMRKALREASLKPEDIQYVNAHGTGTPNNDASESAALRRVYGDQMPAVSSTKSFTGHTTSASGSIETVICLQALRHQFIPVNLNWKHPMDHGVIPFCEEGNGVERPLRHVMCNSFGFGGNDTSLILSINEERLEELKESKADNERGEQVSSPVRIYVRSAAQVSIQQPLCDDWFEHPVTYDTPYAPAVDPVFRDYLTPMQSRRMGKGLKRALVTAQKVMEKSNGEPLDAIISGTGLGCIENTELFLEQICKEGETLLKPTYFMQSTHNTISSMLGIQLQCHGYNTTYSHQGLSFASALLDAFMQMRAGKLRNVLVCANDELTPSYFSIQRKAGVIGQPGQSVAGEGSVSILLTTDPEGAICEISDVRITHQKEAVSPAWSSDVDFEAVFGTGYLSAAHQMYAAIRCLERKRKPNGEAVDSLSLVSHSGDHDMSMIQLRSIVCD